MINSLYSRIFIFHCFYFILTCVSLAQPTFTLGDNSNNNYPVLVKQDGSHSYMLGQSDVNGLSYGTITKVETNSGNLVWQRILDFPSQINDMVFIPPQGPLGKTSLYIVGHTLPFDASNASFLVQIHSETGALECSNIFNQTGRESFRKIVRNMNTPNPNFPYFILGTRGYTGGAPTQEKVILVNLRNGCSGGTNVNFVREYNFANAPDIEFSRGLAVLNDGSMLIMGNETTNGHGMVVKINGAGNFVNGGVYTQNMEVLDATELANGNILFSGKRINNNIETGILFVTDNKLTRLGQAFENTNVLSYQDIATSFSGEIYLPCFYKPSQNTNTTTFPMVQRLNVGGSSTNPLLSFIWQKSLENTNSNVLYKGVSLSADFGSELIYTDGRGLTSANLKISFAKTNTTFSTICSDSVSTLLRPIALGFNNMELSNITSSLPSPIQGNMVGKDWVKSDFCEAPCTLDFTISITERECNNALCNITITNGSIPYTLAWDFNCDGTTDATGIPAQYTFASNGSHQVCIKVMDGKECVKEKSFTIITNGDSEVPVLTCPASITIQCNASTDPSNTGIPTITDNADTNPTLTALDDIVTENTPCLKKIVRSWKALDKCNNESTCTQVITIKDEIAPVFIACGRKIEVQGIKDANGKCKEKVSLLSPAVSDQCDPNPSVVNSYTNTSNATADYNEGTTIVTWTTTDRCGNTSVCRDTVIVNCDSCCINQQAFIDRVQAAVSTSINTEECLVSLHVNGLLSCDELKSINWGDGNTQNGPFSFPLFHSYAVNGTYLINCLFQENKIGGAGCFEQNVATPLDIVCCECNTDNNQIIVSNEEICSSVAVPEFFKISDNHNLEHRWFHSATWTGSEMIIWGGKSSSGDLQTGGRYNPSTDSWQPTTIVNAPTPRQNHSAIWTGSDMIIWGGRNINNFLNNGGIYDPVSNTWQTISTTNAPLPRHYHSSFWTGNRMIIWGGFDNSLADFDNGGIYDPSTDTWTLIQSPVGFNNTQAVWTGQYLIIFSEFDLGFKYDPNNDIWTQFTRPSYLVNFSSLISDGTDVYFYSSEFPNCATCIPIKMGYKYNVTTGVFTNFDVTNAPDIDQEARGFLTNKHIVYFDNNSLDEPFLTGYLYNLGTNKFENYTISYPIESKHWSSKIYADRQFIHWGGRRSFPNIGLPQTTPGNLFNDGYILRDIYKTFSDTMYCNPNGIKNLPCPTADSPHKFKVNVACDNNCDANDISWSLKGPGNNTIKSGVSQNGFTFNLSQAEALTNGIYTLQLDYSCGIDKCSCTSQLNFTNCTTSTLDNALDAQDVKVYPNPTTGQFTLDFKNGNTSFEKAMIYDLQGRLMQTVPLVKDIEKQEIDLSAYDNGVYQIRVVDGYGRSLIKKIVRIN